MRETGFSHVVITTSNAQQLVGFFAALDGTSKAPVFLPMRLTFGVRMGPERPSAG